jgi:hypothetical protein
MQYVFRYLVATQQGGQGGRYRSVTAEFPGDIQITSMFAVRPLVEKAVAAVGEETAIRFFFETSLKACAIIPILHVQHCPVV